MKNREKAQKLLEELEDSYRDITLGVETGMLSFDPTNEARKKVAIEIFDISFYLKTGVMTKIAKKALDTYRV